MRLTSALAIGAFASALGAVTPSASAQSAASVAATPAPLGAMRDTVLPNGLAILVAENHAVPIATEEVVVRTGAFTQERGEEGSSHLFEHLLFRAYGVDQKFAIDVADMEGTYNGATREESVAYYITAPAKEMGGAVKMLAQLVIKPRFREDDIEAERKIVTSEFETDASDPSYLLSVETGRRLWGDEWFRKDALGTARSIGSLKPERVQQIFDRFYVPSSTAVVVSGDVRTADVFAEVARRFGGWKAAGGAPEILAQQAAPSLAPQVFAVAAPHQRLVNVRIVWLGPSVRTDPAAARAASLFSDIVNSRLSPFSTRLIATGLIQSATMAYDPEARRGTVTVDVSILPGAVERALPALRAELDRFASPEYLNDTLLTFAKKAHAVDATFGTERGSGVAHTIAFWWAVAGIDFYRNGAGAIDRLQLGDLATFVTANLVGHPFVAGALTSGMDLDRVTGVMTRTFGGQR